MAAKHTLSLEHTLNGRVNTQRLMSQLRNAGHEVTRVKSAPQRGVVVCMFADDTTYDEALAVIEAHEGQKDDRGTPARIAAYLHRRDKRKDVATIDYRRGLRVRLHPIPAYGNPDIRGEVTAVEYFGQVEMTPAGPVGVPSTLVVRERHEYARNKGQVAISQTKHIDWLAADGTIIITKTRGPKFYTPAESLLEGERRRANHVNLIKFGALGLLVQFGGFDAPTAQGLGGAFLHDIAGNLDFYREAGDPGRKALLAQVTADATVTAHPWLTSVDTTVAGPPTIQAYFQAELA